MPAVTFRSEELGQDTVADYAPDGALTVLDLARANGQPIYWRCARGTCGACAARVTVVNGEVAAMGNRERNVLAREGRPTSLHPDAANWRLTCLYVLSGESLGVEC